MKSIRRHPMCTTQLHQIQQIAEQNIVSQPWEIIINRMAYKWSKTSHITQANAIDWITRNVPTDTWKYQMPLITPYMLDILNSQLILYTEDYREPTMKQLKRDDIIDRFDMILCAGSMPFLSKNSLIGMSIITSTMNCDPNESCMVGDSDCDIEIGNAAGFYTYAISTSGIVHPCANETVSCVSDLIYDKN